MHSKLCVLTLASFSIALSAPLPAVRNAVTDRFLPSGQQELAGIIANRMRANIEGYLEHVDPATLSVDPAGLSRSGILLQAASDAYNSSLDPSLRLNLDKLGKQVMQTRTPDGHVLLGLLSYYSATSSFDAFSAARDVGDLIVKTANAPVGSRILLEETSFLEGLVALYRFTADDRYLNVCKGLAQQEVGHFSFPEIPRATAAEPYQFLSHLRGLLELYRLTGNETYLKPVTAAWKDFAENRVGITGTVGAERSSPVDDCITAAWLRLTLDLLRVTGEPQYAQQSERTIYNQLFAAQDPRSGRIAPALAVAGTKKFEAGCGSCVPNESLAIAAVGSAIWGRYGNNGIAIMQYSAGRTTFQLRRRGAVQIYSEASYPETGEVTLRIDPGRHLNFTLRLRVPDWAQTFTADYAGSHVVGKPGTFLVISRDWTRGDTVRLSIGMNVQVIESATQNGGDVAIQRGPQVLALSKTVNPDLMLTSAATSTNPSNLKLTAVEGKLPPNWATDQVYSVAGRAGSVNRDLFLLPFSDSLIYTIWLHRQEPAAQPPRQ